MNDFKVFNSQYSNTIPILFVSTINPIKLTIFEFFNFEINFNSFLKSSLFDSNKFFLNNLIATNSFEYFPLNKIAEVHCPISSKFFISFNCIL
jgi:hypothetical protein